MSAARPSSAPIPCGSRTTCGARRSSGGGRRRKRRSDVMTALKTVQLELPATTDDLRKLEIGTVVYLTGRVFTAREGAYKHAIEDGAGMPAAKEALGSANFHCSPAARINPDGTYSVAAIPSAPMEDADDVPPHAAAADKSEPGYNVGAVSATASFRFAKWLGRW